jgi:hypothetical protein
MSCRPVPRCPGTVFATFLCGSHLGVAQTPAAGQASDEQIYEKFRAWITRQAPAQQTDVYEKYRAVLAAGGVGASEIPAPCQASYLLTVFDRFRVVRYEDSEGIADFGLEKTRIVRLAAQKP